MKEKAKKWNDLQNEFFAELARKELAAYVGSATYFILVSMLPMLISLCSFLPFTPITELDLLHMIDTCLPDFTHEFLGHIVEDAYNASASTVGLTVLFFFWAGSTGMLSLIRGLNRIDDILERRNYFLLRLIASFYTVVLGILILVMQVILIFGRRIKNLMMASYPNLWNLGAHVYQIRYVTLLILSILIFCLIYAYVPSKSKPFFQQLPGAIFTAIAWTVFSTFFGRYVEKLNPYGLYGSLATTMMLLFWLYICVYIFFVGAFLNRFLRRNKGDNCKKNE